MSGSTRATTSGWSLPADGRAGLQYRRKRRHRELFRPNVGLLLTWPPFRLFVTWRSHRRPGSRVMCSTNRQGLPWKRAVRSAGDPVPGLWKCACGQGVPSKAALQRRRRGRRKVLSGASQASRVQAGKSRRPRPHRFHHQSASREGPSISEERRRVKRRTMIVRNLPFGHQEFIKNSLTRIATERTISRFTFFDGREEITQSL
jgi:hypothetical protein